MTTVLNRVMIILAALALYAGASFTAAHRARGADLSKPATLQEIINLAPVPLSGCYVEASAGGTFLSQGNRTGQGELGAGCTVKGPGIVIVGAGFRQEVGNTVNAGELYGRAGIKLNPHLDLYGLALWRAPNWSLASTGQLYVGGGAETTTFMDNLSVYAEGSTAIAQIGRATKDDIRTTVGFRWWLK